MNFYFDNTYFLVLIGMAIVMFAQYKVKSTFAKYSELKTQHNISGKRAAEAILAQSNIHNVQVGHVPGDLTDHYDSKNKALRLSDATFEETSVAAVAVAAHECGHAVQDATNYSFLRLRSNIFPVVQIGSQMAMPLIFIGFMMGFMGLVKLGIVLFSLVLIFQVVTLPVEFDASKRALAILEANGMFTPEELPAAKEVLNAAAFTYVAATLSTALQLARFIILSNRRND